MIRYMISVKIIIFTLNSNNLGELHTNFDWGNDGRIEDLK